MSSIIAGHSADWHAKRQEGIGGSDIAGIFGLSSWKRPLDIYRLKVGLEGPSQAGEAARRGSRLEADVVRRFAGASGMRITDGHDFLRHPRWPRVRIQANTDGTIEELSPGVFEAKTTTRGSSTARTLIEGRVPTWYATQVQGYLSATGYEWGILAALLGPTETNDWDPDACDLVAVHFGRNDTAIQLIEEVAEEFWHHVDTRRPPRWDRHPAARDLLSALRYTPMRSAL